MAEKLLKNRYLIEDVERDKLGAGSFGTTYLAKDSLYQSFVKKVVVKHLQPPPNSFDIALKFFQREAEVLSKLGNEHPQIPTLVDSFDEDNNFYIVQEWIDGDTLSNILTYGKRLTQKDTIDLLIEILEPLKFCHDEGTIHRDLKPANLMRRRSNGQLVIIDFGAVREVGQLTLMTNGQERVGSGIGSPGYASPEQCAMFPFPVLASDIYAVGSIGIQAMTGLPPARIVTHFEEIPKWWEVPDRSSATPEFTEILNKMLAFSPKARYQNASEALKALKTITSKYSSITGTQSIKVFPTPTQQLRATLLPKITQPHTIIQVAPSLVDISHSSGFVSHAGKLSQEVFDFETAKLEKISPKKVEFAQESEWFFREEQSTRTVEENGKWQLKKIRSQAEHFIEDLGEDIKLEMVYVPAGSFTMGSEEHDSEKPRHEVNVPSFYMGKYQVTQEQYLRIMGESPSKWQDAKLPVEQVSWNDAQVFCQKLNTKTGKKYRLPSEAEWEYACRANTNTPFYFGETISTELANYNGNYIYQSGTKGVYREQATSVGSFPANAFGLHDMHGNVWEWCEDKWHENYQGAPTNGSAWVNGTSIDPQIKRILRGGSWYFNPSTCRSAIRNWWWESFRGNNFGFRIVCAQDF
jgi:eukaryotic-like serine/threonine-protein kinase